MINLKNLKKLREKVDLTQTELAAKVGVSTKTIWCWEQGKNIPHRERRKKLDRILGQLLKEKSYKDVFEEEMERRKRSLP